MSFDMQTHERRILEIRALGYRCKICEATPDLDGDVRHGKGCYQIDENGGGTEHIEDRAADLLIEAGRRLMGMYRSLDDV